MKPFASLSLYLVFLLISGVVLFFSYGQSDQKQHKGEVVLEITPDQLEVLEFVVPKKKIEVRPREKDGYTIMVSETIESKQKDSKDQSLEPKTVTDSYRANQGFERVLEEFLPLRAKRRLSELTKENLNKFGLLDAKQKITIKARGHTVVFTLGAQTFGKQSTYIQQQTSGTKQTPVYLVSASVLRSFDFSAPRFMERKLQKMTNQEVKQVRIENFETREKLTLVKRIVDDKEHWTDVEKPESTNPLFGNWIDRFFRTTTEKYLGSSHKSPSKPLAGIAVQNEQNEVESIVIALDQTDDGKKNYLAKSGFTGEWVSLDEKQASDLLSDLPSLFIE
jgi:hypothetical protein